MANARDIGRSLGGYFSTKDQRGQPPVVLTIKSVQVEAIGQDKEEKPTLAFMESNKKLVLNATRVSQLEGIFGEEDLVGKRIQVVAKDVEVRGRTYFMLAIEAVD